MISTQFEIEGAKNSADVRHIRSALQGVAGIGAIAIELGEGGRAILVLKHKESIELDRHAIESALRHAGDYSLTP